MASLLIKAFPLRQLARRSRPAVMYNVIRNSCDLQDPELYPGPYPTTKKEREAAAKKYGLLPHEYEPFPDDGFGKGDYPNIPDQSAAGGSRCNYYLWDYPEWKRDFNEPTHAYFDMLTEDKGDPLEVYPMPLWKMWAIQIASVLGFVGLFLIFDDYKYGLPLMKQQMPIDKGPHYTFEPATFDDD